LIVSRFCTVTSPLTINRYYLSDAGVAGTHMLSSFNNEQVTNDVTYLTDWKRCDDISLCQYRYLLDAELSKVDLSKELLDLQYSYTLHEDTPDDHV